MAIRILTSLALAAVALLYASPLYAQDAISGRDIAAAVDRYEFDATEASLVGGPGSVGYEPGFWIRAGEYSLHLGFTLQARFESFNWEDTEPFPGGDRSGFSLPRATMKLAGSVPCDVHWYMELEFGHSGARNALQFLQGCLACSANNLGPDNQSNNFDPSREAWIEWSPNACFNFRMGTIRTPTTRQLMTPPEQQQFVDVSLASAWMGLGMPGYTDRNRDFGILLHGALGSSRELGWMVSITNGDGADSIRNVLDHRTSDGLAYGARLNWTFAKPIGYEEGALRQSTCGWHGELGAWAYYYADRSDKPHTQEGDYLRWGVDVALGSGGFSMTGAVSFTDDSDVGGTLNDESTAWLAQVGYHFPGTAFELAARYSGYDTEGDLSGNGSASEIGLAINYYLNGHGNKLQLDVSMLDTEDDGFLVLDSYAAYPAFLGNGESALRLMVQWQLAL
jgi:hypothetical protein